MLFMSLQVTMHLPTAGTSLAADNIPKTTGILASRGGETNREVESFCRPALTNWEAIS